MNVQSIKSKTGIFLLSALLVISSVCVYPAIPARAYTKTELESTSSDEWSLLKLLDMALNEGGLSFSPDAIAKLYTYWREDVISNIETLKADAGEIYDLNTTTAETFINYVSEHIGDIESLPGLQKLTLEYLKSGFTDSAQFCEDFYLFLLPESAFREFLLSYITDEDGNSIGKGGGFKASSKYCIPGQFVDYVREIADAYIEEYEGYYLYTTLTYEDITTSFCTTTDMYYNLRNSLKTIPENAVIGMNAYVSSNSSASCAYYVNFTDVVFVLTGEVGTDYITYVKLYNSDWTIYNPWIYTQSSFVDNPDGVDLSDSSVFDSSLSLDSIVYLYCQPYKTSVLRYTSLYTSDGRTVKIWKSLDSYKAHSVGQDEIYYSSGYGSYDASVDNSITFTGSYYSNNSTTYSHDTIQYNIDNSSTVDESVVNEIVNNYITNNYYYYGDGDSDGSGSDGSSGSWWDIGSGIGSLIEGIASLLDFILDLLGKIISLLAGFLSDILTLLGSLSEVGSEFGEFLASFFAFLPEECISLIITSIGAMCLVGVIKAIKG